MDYYIKARQLNPTTLIIVVNVKLFDGSKVKNQWFQRFLVPITEATHVLFHNFPERFIRNVLITYSLLSSIGTFELMEFTKKISTREVQNIFGSC